MRPAVTQTCADVKSLTLPCGELSYYSSAVSGQLSSNYCTLMAGPITDRLIAWSLPYVQPAVMLIHLFTHRRPQRAAFHTAQMYHNRQAGKCVKVNWDRWSRLTNNLRFYGVQKHFLMYSWSVFSTTSLLKILTLMSIKIFLSSGISLQFPTCLHS